MIIYIINILYDNLKRIERLDNFNDIIIDATYIAELGGAKNNSNIMSIHEILLGVVKRLEKYYIAYNDMTTILSKLFMNYHNNWLIDKYHDTFYKYLRKDRSEIAFFVCRNLLVNYELALTV